MADIQLWPPVDMDPECVLLCTAMNTMPGIRTVESCCGHGREDEPYRIWFEAADLASLPPLLYWFMGCHCGFYGWRVMAKTDCAASPVYFMVEGPVGAFSEADEIAALILDAASSHV